jgi:hypothetical protein
VIPCVAGDDLVVSLESRMKQKQIVIVGATGMVGGYALRFALEDPAVGRLLWHQIRWHS